MIKLSFALIVGVVTAAHNILDQKNLTLGRHVTVAQQRANSIAFQNVVALANSSQDDRVVLVPKNVTIEMMPVSFSNLTDVVLDINGALIASDEWKSWPVDIDSHAYYHFMQFSNCNGLTFQSSEKSGKIDGQGYMWWIREFMRKNIYRRPKLIEIIQTENIEFSGIFVTNSPSFHIQPADCKNVYMHDFEIYVDMFGILNIWKLFGHNFGTEFDTLSGLNLEFPTFPLNTDGIDFQGRNGTFRNIKITNFDDAIVAKPSNKGLMMTDCTQDILVENCEVYFGVGMAMGSVSPHPQHNCIKNVVVRNVEFHHPFKAVYIKTNPVSVPPQIESGEITNIWYENLRIWHPIWWGIYIGPQQMKQPTGEGPGCMIYPLNKDCPTDPLVPITNVTLKNVTSTGGLLPAGIIRCNSTKPCTGFHFEDVNISQPFWDMIGRGGYMSEYVEG